MDSIKQILGRIFILGCLVGSLTGCNEEDRTPLSGERMVQVQLDVHTRAVDASTGTPTAEESDLHSLRIYAFDNSGQQVGHLNLTDGLDTSNPLLMDLKIKAEPTEQPLRFYAVANEGAMSTPGNEKTLDANTSETELKNFTFTTLKSTADFGLPMFDVINVTIHTNDITPQTQVGHEGHYTLNEKVNFELERPVGKLGVFAAKVEGETETLTVTGARILKEGTRMMNYLFPQTDEVLKQIVPKEAEINLTLVTGGNVNTALSENISDEERKNPGNYTPLLEVPFYPFETPWGSASWNTPGDERGAVLQIDYQFGNKTNTGLVYLPRIERNHYYAICCLMRNSGKITVEYVVADWDDGGNYELDFAYPTYTNPIEPMEGASYSQPKVYYNPDPDSDEGTFKARFQLTAPEGQEWQPTLLNATPADYEITVYQSGEQGMQKVEPPYVASSSDYVIKIRALKSDNAGRTVELGIGYIPRWDPGAMSLLQINGTSGDTKWPGSDDPEKIVILQEDPTTVNP
ncbi:fimbrial protein [Caecibacteroides pullorum]|nr:fimbrial protein [Caecibacteroides pullorum]